MHPYIIHISEFYIIHCLSFPHNSCAISVRTQALDLCSPSRWWLPLYQHNKRPMTAKTKAIADRIYPAIREALVVAASEPCLQQKLRSRPPEIVGRCQPLTADRRCWMTLGLLQLLTQEQKAVYAIVQDSSYHEDYILLSADHK